MCRDIATGTKERDENGTLNNVGITSLHESIGTPGIDNIEEHILDLSDTLIEELRLLGLKAYVKADRSNRAGIISFAVPDAPALAARPASSKIEVAVRQGLARVSPHFYNTEEEIRAVVEIIKKK